MSRVTIVAMRMSGTGGGDRIEEESGGIEGIVVSSNFAAARAGNGTGPTAVTTPGPSAKASENRVARARAHTHTSEYDDLDLCRP